MLSCSADCGWHFHNQVPKLPPDEDEILHARRVIAQRCLYGVDKNPMAVDLAKLSLWLATLAKDHPFTFLDHALRPGDSLVGLTQEQIAGFHWAPKRQRDLFRRQIEDRMKHVTKYRQEILAARDDVFYEYLRSRLEHADEQLSLARLAGNVIVSAFFAADNDRKRQTRLDELEVNMAAYLSPQGKMEDRQPLAEAEKGLWGGERPIQPFHWWIEFPEVFDRTPGGFDVIIGNPPFLGGKRVSGTFGESYRDWLPTIHEETISNSDLVAHFFRRAFTLLREGGALGLIGTNTIAQGDTRITGLRWICACGGTIYAATKRTEWPGAAAVIISVVHVTKGEFQRDRFLDGKKVPTITAFLYHAGGHENPITLSANDGLSFQGCIVLGMGFTFDDSDKDGVATPLAEMRRLIQKDARNAERIFPYIGGEEMLNHPTQKHDRYVINFGEMGEAEARLGWPDLMAIIEEKVKPERMKKVGSYKTNWWLFGRRNLEGTKAIASFDRVLMHSFTSSHLAFAFIPSATIIAGPHCVFAVQSYAGFCSLQSRPHEVWARFTSSTLKDDLSYKISDCFETFPFSPNWQDDVSLETAGRTYYEFRAALMVHNKEGLTKTYNRFHDPSETSSDIVTLRELHATMDRAVLDAYGWTDLRPTCEFLLDYEDEEDEENGTTSRRKKPWRYRWPDDFRDEVLARLLALNQERAQQEALAGKAAEAKAKPTTRKRTPRKGRADDDRPLLK